MKRKFFIGALVVLIGFFTLSTTAMAGTLLGKYCFKMDTFPDTWIWQVDKVGTAYQVTGYNSVEGSSMDGGGSSVPFNPGKVYFTINEYGDFYVGGGFGNHHFILDLATLTGISYTRFSDITGAVIISYPSGIPISKIACPADADTTIPDGPRASGQ
ncbi:MAG: hypothetical protein A2W23_08085 [Planctomycetes bacterium RBG_16_43_13]|nr:MAG: hypothetical protein A2W23_08085 [Planctomycetes bacterium RBG_16_43_13]